MNQTIFLGIEYLKALKRRKSPSVHSRSSGKEHTIMTLFLMKLLVLPLQSANFFSPKEKMPFLLVGPCSRQTVHLLCKEAYNIRFPVCSNDFSLLLKYRLLQETADSLVHWQDISSPLANRIIRCRDQFQNWEQFCELLKTKELTYTRISRALLHVCLEFRT